VTVFINTDRFSTDAQYANSVTFELACATDSTKELLEWSLKGLEQIYRDGYKYRKAGVMLNHLKPADQLSMRLYDDPDFERSRRVMKAIDAINARHGQDTVRFGIARPNAGWQTKFLRRSMRYTTRLQEVLSVC